MSNKHPTFKIEYLRTNPYTLVDEKVPERTAYGFWRVIEFTGAGWFPWPGIYTDKKRAELVRDKAIEKHGV